MSGLFGVVSDENCSKYLLYGTDYHSHLGTSFGGVAILGEELKRQIHNINSDQFKSKFREDIFNLHGEMGIGVISASDEQPIYINSKFGPFCLIMDGFINNAEELAGELFDRGITFSELGHNGVNHAELVAKLITQAGNVIEGIDGMFDKIEGSCSLLLLHHDGIYAARDRLGYSSLAVGSRNGELAVASESTSFLNLEFKPESVLRPGEIVLLSRDGLKTENAGEESRNHICAFLWIYTGFPTSDYEGINVEAVRERCGRCLARRDAEIEADVVSGVPDSGVAHAVGYSMESGEPYRRPLVKYTPGYGRSYTPTSQNERDLIARMKLVANESIIRGNRIVVCEDSIVRGTQLKNFTVRKLWEAGAREIHVRPACPPLMFPCIFNLSTRSIHELAARRAIREIEGSDIEDVSEYIDHTTAKYARMVELIREDIEVTTLKYQTIEDMVEAIGLPREKLCLYCWNGETP